MYPYQKENQKKIKKWPDIIGVGFPKCGTGAMAFLDCHSEMVFREAEGMLWHKYDKEDCHPNLAKYPVPLARVLTLIELYRSLNRFETDYKTD